MTWRKSSYSASQTACVELAWRKSTFSASQTDCVELAAQLGGVAVRDSKNPGRVLLFDARAHTALLASLTVDAELVEGVG